MGTDLWDTVAAFLIVFGAYLLAFFVFRFLEACGWLPVKRLKVEATRNTFRTNRALYTPTEARLVHDVWRMFRSEPRVTGVRCEFLGPDTVQQGYDLDCSGLTPEENEALLRRWKGEPD